MDIIKTNDMKNYLEYMRSFSMMFVSDTKSQQQLACEFICRDSTTGEIDEQLVIQKLRKYKRFVLNFAQKNLIDDYCRKNLYNILGMVRENYKNNEVLEIVNEIYRKINSQMTDESDCLYTYEFIARFGRINIAKDNQLLKQYIPIVRESILLDKDIIYSHVFANEEEFKNEYANNLIGSDYYFNSLRYIIQDKKYLLNDISFLKRYKYIIENHNLLKESLKNKMIKKSLIKDIDKQMALISKAQ